MKCPNCGNSTHPSQIPCSFCGCELPPLPLPPEGFGWGLGQPFKREEAKEKPLPLRMCPLCGKISLFWDKHKKIYECLNSQCQAMGVTSNSLLSWRLALQGATRKSRKLKLRNTSAHRRWNKPKQIRKALIAFIVIGLIVSIVVTTQIFSD